MVRFVAPEIIVLEEEKDFSIRPDSLKNFVGQKNICDNLSIYLEAAKARNETIDHILFSGPPGLGKTTLSQIIATEMGGSLKSTSAPLLTKPGDIATILTGLDKNSVLFIDEIHRLPSNVEELLYAAMEDCKLDLLIGEGPSARTLEVKLAPFTLVGATTKAGSLSKPLRDRFGISFRLDYYSVDDIVCILQRSSRLLTMQISDEACFEVAKRSRGTPRIANRILKRLRDYTAVSGKKIIDISIAKYSLEKIGIDKIGLDELDRKYLDYLFTIPNRSPVGLETISAILSENKETVEDVIEPYLLQEGLIQRTPRGRILTDYALTYLLTYS